MIFQKPFRGVRYSQCCQERYSSFVYASDFAMFLNWQEQQKHWRYFLRAEVQFGEQFKSHPMVTCGKSFSFWYGKSERVNFLVQKYIVTNLNITGSIDLSNRNSSCGRPSLLDMVAESGDRQKVLFFKSNLQYWQETKANLTSKT